MQIMQSNSFYCKITLHVSGDTAPITRSAKNCNRSLRYKDWLELTNKFCVVVNFW